MQIRDLAEVYDRLGWVARDSRRLVRHHEGQPQGLEEEGRISPSGVQGESGAPAVEAADLKAGQAKALAGLLAEEIKAAADHPRLGFLHDVTGFKVIDSRYV